MKTWLYCTTIYISFIIGIVLLNEWWAQLILLIGLIIFTSKLVKDVTSVKTGVTITETEALYSHLLESMQDFVCYKDGDGKWLYVNEFGKQLYCMQNVDYVGKTDTELGELIPFFKESFDYCKGADEKSWEIGVNTRGDEAFYIPSGEFKTFDVIKIPLFHPDGSRKALVTIGRDISQLKETEAIVLQREKLGVIGELAAGIAHEVKNPITTLQGFVQLISESGTVDKYYTEVMKEELDRIHIMSSEWLSLAKPQAKTKTPCNILEVIDYVTSLLQPEATKESVVINWDTTCPQVDIMGDRQQLIQIFINIIKNAIEAMPTGGNVFINCSVEDSTIVLSIKDTGVGISKERLKHIGQPFFTLKEKGLGLGLTLTTKMVQEHKGTLEINSEETVGTVVKVTLPIYEESVA